MLIPRLQLHSPKCHSCFQNTDNPHTQIFLSDLNRRVVFCSSKCIRGFYFYRKVLESLPVAKEFVLEPQPISFKPVSQPLSKKDLYQILEELSEDM